MEDASVTGMWFETGLFTGAPGWLNKHMTLGFHLGHDLRVIRSSPASGFTFRRAWDSFPLPPSLLFPPPSHPCSCSHKQTDKQIKNLKQRSWGSWDGSYCKCNRKRKWFRNIWLFFPWLSHLFLYLFKILFSSTNLKAYQSWKHANSVLFKWGWKWLVKNSFSTRFSISSHGNVLRNYN